MARAYRYIGPPPPPQIVPGDEVRVLSSAGGWAIVSHFGTVHYVQESEIGNPKLWHRLDDPEDDGA